MRPLFSNFVNICLLGIQRMTFLRLWCIYRTVHGNDEQKNIRILGKVFFITNMRWKMDICCVGKTSNMLLKRRVGGAEWCSGWFHSETLSWGTWCSILTIYTDICNFVTGINYKIPNFKKEVFVMLFIVL